MKTKYEPTLGNTSLNAEQHDLMVEAIDHIEASPCALKKLTRWQFWFRKIYDMGYEAGADSCIGTHSEEGTS